MPLPYITEQAQTKNEAIPHPLPYKHQFPNPFPPNPPTYLMHIRSEHHSGSCPLTWGAALPSEDSPGKLSPQKARSLGSVTRGHPARTHTGPWSGFRAPSPSTASPGSSRGDCCGWMLGKDAQVGSQLREHLEALVSSTWEFAI